MIQLKQFGAILALSISPVPGYAATSLPFEYLAHVASGGALPTAPKPPTVSDAITVLDRLTDPTYEDGVGEPAELGRPSPRDLSNQLSVSDNEVPDARPMSNLAVAFSQFFASHEIARSPTNPTEALNIEVDPNDPIAQTSGGVPVMIQSRSSFEGGTGPGDPREQLNDVSKALDGSTVYGSDQATEDLLRTFDGNGTMKTAADGGLPIINGRRKAGDVRADENLALQALHELFLKEHNRLAGVIAEGCAAEGLSCSGDEIFHGAKTIVAAQQEKIFYDEFLPIFLGSGDLKSLVPDQTLFDSPGGVINEFTTAAGRIGHTQVPAVITAALPGEKVKSQTLAECFFSEQCLPGETLDALLFGAAKLDAEPIDTVVTETLRNSLVSGFGSDILIDLFATNINRGRDHGLGDFSAVREALGFAITDASLLLPDYVLDAYGGAPVDLLVALFAEAKAPGSYLGETGAALWALQFEWLRSTDGILFDPEFASIFEGLTMAELIAANTGLSASDFGRSAFLAPVPVPPAFALLLAGFAALVPLRRRQIKEGFVRKSSADC